MLSRLSTISKTSLMKHGIRSMSSTASDLEYIPPRAENNIMERLNNGVVIGDGGFVFALEKRGYVKAGPWTPEVNMEHPFAVSELHREFARSGSDVMQTFTFYASEDKLENRDNYAKESYGVFDINEAACDIAFEVANQFDCLVAGGICQTPSYLTNLGENSVKNEFNKQLYCFKKKNVDFMIVEYFEHVEECCWAIEAVKDEMPLHAIAATLCINEEGDLHHVSAYDCALKMAESGANIVGLNCHFDPNMILKGIEKMKLALDKNGLLFDAMNNPNGIHLMTQPVAYHTPDVSKQGFIDLPEFPFALEPRLLTRWEMHDYARNAYDLGVRYIGGCCGFEPYHIRAVCEELENERNGKQCDASIKHEKWAGGLEMHTKPWVRSRANQTYWQNLRPASGRPLCPACSKPDNWGVTQGNTELHQSKHREQKSQQMA